LNPRLKKINDDIDKTKKKIAENQSRLKELERQKKEIENANILATVRDFDVTTEELAEIMRVFKDNRNGVLPVIEAIKNKKDKEDLTVEK